MIKLFFVWFCLNHTEILRNMNVKLGKIEIQKHEYRVDNGNVKKH